MNIRKIMSGLRNCPCGREHRAELERVEIGRGYIRETGRFLRESGFPDRLLLVADVNTLAAAEGVCEVIAAAGFELKKLVYPDFKYARDVNVEEVTALCGDVGGIVSVGSGSLNDICRVPAARLGLPLCIVATAPSMDGFASDTSPILRNNFKETWKAAQPKLIVADTDILAAAPVELKAAGLGDMAAKYIAITDWRISALITGEYYCKNIADMTLDAVSRCLSLAGKLREGDPEAAASVMEGLVMSGLAMKLAGCSRPASGAEHMTSHFLEDYKCLRGIWPEFHGKKVGVATLILAGAYRRIAKEVEAVEAGADPEVPGGLLSHFDPEFRDDIAALNRTPITDIVDPEKVKAGWQDIRKIILDTVPDENFLRERLLAAGGAVTLDEIHTAPGLMKEALRYHSYMRHRLFLTRILPLAGVDLLDYVDLPLKAIPHN